jgi:tripartite-type tricarboxylate transporter receptor subunit TctC
MQVFTALLLMSLSTLSFAQETITILWGFNIGSNQANTIRILCNELNQSQDRYVFVIGHKPGAGGTVAANEVTKNPKNTLVSMSSSFVIRPYYEKDQQVTHNLDNFTPIFVQGTGSPLFIVSGKYQTIDDLLAAPNLNIGVSGIGSVSHLAANEITKSNKNVTIVNFKDMIEASIAASGGHIDAAVGFLPDLQGMLDTGKINVLGYTGQQEIKEYPGLLLSKKIHRLSKLTANYAIFASKDMPNERFIEIHNMMATVNHKPLVLDSYQKDLINISNLNISQSQKWYDEQRRYWQIQVEQIKK